MKQCLLEKKGTTTTSWIPEEFSVKGKVINIKDDNDKWDNGWLVKEVYSHSVDEKVVNLRSQDYKKNRKASDI